MNSKNHLEKKTEKIARNQSQIQTLQEKLKEEEIVRKKTTEKNK